MLRFYKIALFIYNNPIKVTMHTFYLFGMIGYIYRLVMGLPHAELGIFVLNMLVLSPIMFLYGWLYSFLIKKAKFRENTQKRIDKILQKRYK